jgi:hypothetical protein
MELGCSNLPSLLLYGRVLGYNNQPKDEVGVLLKAATLFPESDEVKLELGATLVRNGNYGSAAATLLAVKKVGSSAEAFRLFYNLAYAQYRLSDMAGARTNSGKARTYTKIPAQIASLDRLQQALDRPTSLAGAAVPSAGEDAEAPQLLRHPSDEAPVERVNPGAPQLPSVEERWRTWNAELWPDCTCARTVR